MPMFVMVRSTARAVTRSGPSNPRAMIADRAEWAAVSEPKAMQATATAIQNSLTNE